MVTKMDNASSGIYSQTQAGNNTATAIDTNKDGLIDKVKIASGDKAIASDVGSKDFMSVNNQNFAEVQQVLQNMGLGIVSDAQGNEVLANLSEPLKMELGVIAKETASALVTNQGSTNNLAQLQGKWANFVSGSNVRGEVDVNALVQHVLREAYMENTKDLQFYAQKVKFYNEAKDAIRNKLVDMRTVLADQAGQLPDAALVGGAMGKESFDSTPVWSDNEGRYVANGFTADGNMTTKQDLETYIQNLEEKLNSIGDDAQLANVDLQNMLQKQQQTLQMMSNISKMLHDTGMAIIRKIGG